MTNKSRIQANNAKLRDCIDVAENLPEAGASFPSYEGTYTVVPSTVEEITLATAQKVLLADVKVNKIPYAEVSNNKGGKTVTIGNEV